MKKLFAITLLACFWLVVPLTSFTGQAYEAVAPRYVIPGTGTMTATSQPTLSPTITPTRRLLITGEVDGLWSTPVDITEGRTTNWRAYPIAICDPYQNLHIFWADNITDMVGPGDTQAAFYYRTDIEGYLSVPRDILAVRDRSIHFPAVAISRIDDTFHLIWVNTPNGLLYYSSAPIALAMDARAWLTPVTLDYQVFNGALITDRNGTVHVFYGRRADDFGLLNEVIHQRLEKGAKDWAPAEVVFTRRSTRPSQIRTEAAIDGAGRIHLGLTIRSVVYGATSEVGYLRSPDGGTRWDDYQLFERDGKSFQGVEWIAPYAFGYNEVHLTWHDPERMHTWSSDGGVTWSEPSVMLELGGAYGGSNDLIKDSEGVLRVIVAVNGGVYTAAWDGENWGPAELIDGREIDMHGQRIVLCRGNRLHTFFYDRTGPTTSWYSTRRIDLRAATRRPVPSLSPTATMPAPTSTPQPLVDDKFPTQPVLDLSSYDRSLQPPASPIMPVLFPALIAVAMFTVVAMIVQLMRIKF